METRIVFLNESDKREELVLKGEDQGYEFEGGFLKIITSETTAIYVAPARVLDFRVKE